MKINLTKLHIPKTEVLFNKSLKFLSKQKLQLLALIFFLSAFVGIAQQPTYYLDPNKKLFQYNLETWSTDNGLPTNSILSICQSEIGYLWIGSYDGLIRFDGQNFKVYNQFNTPQLKSNNIRRIIESHDGTLWMTTQGSGLVSMKDDKFKTYGSEEGLSNLYRALCLDSKGRIWATSPDKGWFYFENEEFTFLEYEYPLEETEVRAIVEDKFGGMWFGTLGKGLYYYKDNKFKVYSDEHGLINNWIYSIYLDTQGVLWVGTLEGVCYYEDNRFHEYKIPGIGTINDIVEDIYNNLWISSTTGLYRLNKRLGEIEHLDADRGLEHNFINDLLFDFEGNLWMANYKGGLSQLKDGKFTNYSAFGGLHGKVVNAICELDSNTFLSAFDNGKLSLLKNGNIEAYYTRSQLEGKRIRHILKDSDNNLWFSTYSGLLKVLPGGREKWYNKSNGFPGTQIRVAFEDSRGRIWVGTRNNGLVRFNEDNSLEIFDISNGLSSNLIMSIEEAPNGKMLIGTSEGVGGLNVLDNDKVETVYSTEDGLTSDIVFNTYTDKQGITWIAANGGISSLKEGKITSYTVNEGLKCDNPFDILEDDNGFLWLPSSKGIIRIDRDELLKFDLKSGDQLINVLFDKHDGMNQSECNPTTQALKASNGTMLFPTIDGITQIDPMYIPVNNYYPPVVIEELITDKGAVDKTEQIIIDSKNKRITFKYTGISLYEPAEVVFRYQLDGFEDKWVATGNTRTVSYTNLSPGPYTFRVIASNNDGISDNLGTSLKFYVEPQFHETGIFLFIIAIIILGVGYTIYVIRIRQLKAKQTELQKKVEIRTSEILIKNQQLETQKSEIELQANKLEEQSKELKIINASKDKMFSIIAHDLRGPLGNFRTILDIILNDPESYDAAERQEMLMMLSENAKSTYELLENLLNWSVSQQGLISFQPEEFNVVPVINDIFSTVMPMAVKKEINVLNKVDETVLVYADLNMTRLVFRNLISNAIKFTDVKGEIIVQSHSSGAMIEFGIRDNGIGMSESVLHGLFDQLENTLRIGTHSEKGSGLGLILCKEFVERNGGKLRVESSIGKGSTFYFTVPRTK